MEQRKSDIDTGDANSVNVNANGRCNYCHTIFDLANYDWIITYMEI